MPLYQEIGKQARQFGGGREHVDSGARLLSVRTDHFYDVANCNRKMTTKDDTPR